MSMSIYANSELSSNQLLYNAWLGWTELRLHMSAAVF